MGQTILLWIIVVTLFSTIWALVGMISMFVRLYVLDQYLTHDPDNIFLQRKWDRLTSYFDHFYSVFYFWKKVD